MSTNTEKSRESLLRTGYSADFLGTDVGVPTLDEIIRDDAVLWEGSEVIPYTHFPCR